MKKLLLLVALASMAWSASPGQVSASFGLFYSSLGPHGDWISIDGGMYAWHPVGVVAGWRPYVDGHWIWTDDGWYWDTDEPWGWATYHYGRWYYDDFYGWVWLPGYEWAPAWVEWRYGGSWIGWAPLGPYAVFSVGWGIHYRRYWATPAFYWSFVDCRYIGSHSLHRYMYRTDDNTRLIGRTRTAGSVRYDNGRIVTRGPEREFVERRGNIRVERADLVDVRERTQAGLQRDGSRERVSVYRPRIEMNEREAAGLRPDRVRTDDRRLGLDPRGTDLRRAEAGNAQRDLRRAEEFRRRSDAGRVDGNRPSGSVRPVPPADRRPGYSPSVPRGERRVERAPARPPEYVAPPSRGEGRWAPAPRIERSTPSGPRMSSPERGGGRSAPPASRGSSPRGSGGGTRGGERGGRR
ncbi:MAG: DUF6600 domain-containing protein [Bacteroidota bacterium]